MQKAKLSLYLCILGVAAAVFLSFGIGLMTPNYSLVSQYISELSASGAEYEQLAKWLGFFPAGLLLTAFCFLAWRQLPKSILTNMGFLGLGFFTITYWTGTFFPCDPGCPLEAESTNQLFHNFFGGLGYLVGYPALFVVGLGARQWKGGRWLSILAILFGVLGFLSLGLLDHRFAIKGLVQRFMESSMHFWLIACAFYLQRQTSK